MHSQLHSQLHSKTCDLSLPRKTKCSSWHVRSFIFLIISGCLFIIGEYSFYSYHITGKHKLRVSVIRENTNSWFVLLLGILLYSINCWDSYDENGDYTFFDTSLSLVGIHPINFLPILLWLMLPVWMSSSIFGLLTPSISAASSTVTVSLSGFF